MRQKPIKNKASGRFGLLLALQFVGLIAAALHGAPALASTPARQVSAEQFREDVAFLRESITRMHPNPAFSTDPVALERALDEVQKQLPPTLTIDQAWQRLATLNPQLADAHFFVGYADWRADTRQWLASGGSLFPVEVDVGRDGKLYLRPDAPSAAPTRIVSVNEVAADTVLAALQARVHGDTPGFCDHLLSQRWWLFYWKMYGAPERYRLVLEQAGKQRTVEMAGRRELPLLMRKETQSPFKLAIGADGNGNGDGTAVLTVDTFSQPDPAPFREFTRKAFSDIKDQGVKTLVIDISSNGGGDDGMWLDGLMPYLATKPYRTGSTYRAMSRPQANTPATVSDGEISTWRQPQPDNPLRFTGKIQVRIGPGTYSSAVLFANVMRDFGFATLVGSGGWARTTQSGGVRDAVLPNTGLIAVLPRFILDPPAGRSPGAMLVTTEATTAAATEARPTAATATATAR